jgi:hypothetical protein
VYGTANRIPVRVTVPMGRSKLRIRVSAATYMCNCSSPATGSRAGSTLIKLLPPALALFCCEERGKKVRHVHECPLQFLQANVYLVSGTPLCLLYVSITNLYVVNNAGHVMARQQQPHSSSTQLAGACKQQHPIIGGLQAAAMLCYCMALIVVFGALPTAAGEATCIHYMYCIHVQDLSPESEHHRWMGEHAEWGE